MAEQAPKETAGEKLDKQLAAQAIKKMQSGAVPTGSERSALKRVEKRREEQKRWEFYRSVPQRHYLAMAGRQAKVVNEQAERYGLPIAAKEISLPDTIKRFHDLLAEYAHVIAAAKADGGDLTLANKIKETKLAQEQLKLAQLKGELVPVSEVSVVVLETFANIARGIEFVRRSAGLEVVRPILEAIEISRAEWQQRFQAKHQGGNP